MNSIDNVCAVLALEHKVLPLDTAIEILDLSATNLTAATNRLFEEVTESALLGAIGQEMGYTYVNLSAARMGLKTDATLMTMVDPTMLRRYSALPMRDPLGHIVVVVANPTNPDLRNYLAQVYESPQIFLGSHSQIQARLVQSSPVIPGLDEIAPTTDITLAAQPAQSRNPIVAWVDSVLESAVAQDASDVHFDHTDSQNLLLRFRVDGILRSIPAPVRGHESEVIGILMNRSGMDAANQREPQDGAFSFTTMNRKIDVRVAILPQSNGTSAVLRLLDSNNVRRRLMDMGFSHSQLSMITSAIHAPQGTIIVCGPTGSGKTTTLYAMVREIAVMEKNVETIEDPVEYHMPLVNQTAVTRTTDGRSLSFDRALRAIMRMDPDIILVGEIRDKETAKTAMDAAITGHLVLSTIHTRDAVAIYTRLSEMGVPNYMVADAMTLGVSQRLARRVHSCAELSAPTPLERETFERNSVEVPETVMRPVGCDGCSGSGFQGRVAVVEVFAPTKEFRTLVLAALDHDALFDQALADGFVPMIKEGLRLVSEGHTTVAEVLRVTEQS